jgi:hypothetical protein
MSSIRSMLFFVVFAALLAVPTAAMAGDGCTVMVVREGEPVAGVRVSGMDADGSQLPMAKTNENGKAMITKGLQPIKIKVDGAADAVCNGQLIVDLAKQAVNTSGATPPANDPTPASSGSGSGGDSATPAQSDDDEKAKKKKRETTSTPATSGKSGKKKSGKK